jgi:hypothetical protein
MVRYRKILLFAALVATGLSSLSGCGAFGIKPLTVWTSRPEILAYAEIFNSRQDNYRVEVEYRENPSSALDHAPDAPDLVFAEHLASSSSIKRFRSLDRVFEPKAVQKNDFCPGILALGQRDNQQALFPVSFNLPVLMFDSRFGGTVSTKFTLGMDDIQEFGRDFNRDNGKGRWTNLGFSPLWAPEFIVMAVIASGANFTEDGGRRLSWNEKNLADSLSYIKKWIETVNKGYALDSAFSDKYLYDPPYKLLGAGRIEFAYTDSADFFLLPEGRRSSLDFRWVAAKGRIAATDAMLFAGMPLKAKNIHGAEAFLQWLFNKNTQKELLSLMKSKIPYSFGIASGFSAIYEVNESYFPLHYPSLVAHIPPKDMISFAPPFPGRWNRFKNEVLSPWLLGQLSDKAGSGDLKEKATAWSLNQTD